MSICEFYESYDLPLELGELRQVVREWECICNFLRPSRSLGGKTPWEYLMENHREAVSFDAKLSQVYRTPTFPCLRLATVISYVCYMRAEARVRVPKERCTEWTQKLGNLRRW